MSATTRCAVVALVGPPNAGKSTLLNHLAGQHLAIVSARPQSTRSRVNTVVTHDNLQLLIVDTPGLLDPKYHLHRAMQAEAREAVSGADIVLFLVDGAATHPQGPEILESLGVTIKAPLIVALSKADAPQPDGVRSFDPELRLSGKTGQGIPELLDRLRELALPGPFHYPVDDLSTQPLRFFVSEALREVLFEVLEEELPYAVHVEIDEFREEKQPVYIRATLHVERDSQKRIVIGSGGSQIREIGSKARGRIEALVGSAVYLDLWVKVVPNWRRDIGALQRFGFALPKD